MKPSKTGRPVDETALQAALALFEDKMDGYERVLSQRPYLGGNLTLADLYHLPLGTKIIDAGHGSALTDSKKRPHVAKYACHSFRRQVQADNVFADGGQACRSDQAGKLFSRILPTGMRSSSVRRRSERRLRLARLRVRSRQLLRRCRPRLLRSRHR